MATRWAVCAMLALVAAPLVATQDAGEYVIYIDNHESDFLRAPVQAPMSADGVAAALSALLDVPPVLLNDASLASQVDSLLVPTPFSRPDAVFSVEVYGAQEEFPLGSDNVAACCAGCAHHVRPLEAEAASQLSTIQDAVGMTASTKGLVHTDLQCEQIADTCDAQCMDAALDDLAAILGGEYVHGSEPLTGTLKVDTEEFTLAASDAEQAFAGELACLSRAAAKLPQAESAEDGRPVQRHLLTGKLDSLEKVKAAHGKESSTYKSAARIMAKGIGAAKKAVRDVFNGKLVGQVALLEKKAQGTAQRRTLLAKEGDEGDYRDIKEWQSSAMMGMVGFSLLVITVLCTMCMFSMDLKQDTILYGKSKSE